MIVCLKPLPKGFDLYVDGHIHSRVEADVHGKKFLIPGSTVLTQLKEGEQEAKGFIVFDTKSYTHEFIKINSRPLVFKSIEFDSASPKMVKDLCEKEIDQVIEKAAQMPIIKLRLQGTIDKGFSNVDMPLHSLLVKYSPKAIIEIDSSRLLNPETQSDIENLRDNKIGNMPVKELGMNILGSKLKEQKFDEKINYSELFNILSSDSKKEKALKEASEFLSDSQLSA